MSRTASQKRNHARRHLVGCPRNDFSLDPEGFRHRKYAGGSAGITARRCKANARAYRSKLARRLDRADGIMPGQARQMLEAGKEA